MPKIWPGLTVSEISSTATLGPYVFLMFFSSIAVIPDRLEIRAGFHIHALGALAVD